MTDPTVAPDRAGTAPMGAGTSWTGDPDGPATDAAEARVLERIESFRRRRPRLRDEVVTLAHGAGGKASAALVDAVFADAFGLRRTERPSLDDAALLLLPDGGRV